MSVGVAIATMAMSAAATVYTSSQQAAMAGRQEKMAEYKARLAQSDADKQAADQIIEGHRMAAKQQMVVAATGGDISDEETSPYKVISATIGQANKTAQSIRNRGALSAAANNYEAASYSSAAKGYLIGGALKAGSTIASSTASMGTDQGWW